MTLPPDEASPQAHLHATAMLVGCAGVLIRGPSGTGKSSLALALAALAARAETFARLVGDDRVRLAARNGRLLAYPHPITAGLIERRLLGLQSVPFEPAGVIRFVVDLSPDPAPARMPNEAALETEILGVRLARLGVPARPDDAARQLIFDRVRAL